MIYLKVISKKKNTIDVIDEITNLFKGELIIKYEINDYKNKNEDEVFFWIQGLSRGSIQDFFQCHLEDFGGWNICRSVSQKMYDLGVIWVAYSED